MSRIYQSIGRDAAIALGETKWWEGKTHREIAEFQLLTDELCCPFPVFHEAVEKTLGRPVFTHEFGMNRDGIAAELLDGKEAPTFQEILELIPSEKRASLSQFKKIMNPIEQAQNLTDAADSSDSDPLDPMAVESLEPYLTPTFSQRIEAIRAALQNELSALANVLSVYSKVPASFRDYAVYYNCGIDFDHLSREQVEQFIRESSFGKWKKSISHHDSSLMDYEATVDGVRVRLYAAGPPGSCRVVEEVEVIPEQRVVKKKLICTPDDAALKPAL